jgi:hypothetical protein
VAYPAEGMNMSWRSRPVGWRNDSYRHYLASKGFKTVRSKAGHVGSVHGVPITAQPLQKGEAYPVSPEEVKKELELMPKEDLRGLKEIQFVRPRDKEQEGAWAQMVRSKRKMLIFSQPVKNGKMDDVKIGTARSILKNYVIKHELGHHVALYNRKRTDSSMSMAEARADAYVVGMDVEDRDVGKLQRFKNN